MSTDMTGGYGWLYTLTLPQPFITEDVMSASCSPLYENVYYSYKLLTQEASYDYAFSLLSLT